jgi:hypothetical protein
MSQVGHFAGQPFDLNILDIQRHSRQPPMLIL